MQTAATTTTGSKQDSKNNRDNNQRKLNQSCGPLQHRQPYQHSKRSLLVSHLICCKVSCYACKPASSDQHTHLARFADINTKLQTKKDCAVYAACDSTLQPDVVLKNKLHTQKANRFTITGHSVSPSIAALTCES
jgi:hypothetical protein